MSVALMNDVLTDAQKRMESISADVSKRLISKFSVEDKSTRWIVCFVFASIDSPGVSFDIVFDEHKKRWIVSGNWPLYNGAYVVPDESVKITVACDSSPEVIARHINRRFLPWFTETIKKLNERIDRARKNDTDSEAQFSALCKSIGYVPSERESKSHSAIVYKGMVREIRVAAPDCVYVEIDGSLRFEEASRVVALLAALR